MLQKFCYLCVTCIQAEDLSVIISLNLQAGLPILKWLGFKVSSSLISLGMWVSGLEFAKPSLPTTILVKMSNVSFAEPRFMRRARLTI